MEFDQRNPLPVPESGALQAVESRFDSSFDWQYALDRRELMALYEKGKSAAWNASDLDWSQEVDVEKIAFLRSGGEPTGAFNALLAPPHPLDDAQVLDFNLQMNAWMLSQFLHGEQGALLATAKIVQQVPWEEAKFYAANQVADEARHVEVYHRYLTEKLGCSFEVNANLQTLLNDILSDSRWDMTYLGMQIMVEGLALAAFGLQRMLMSEEPLICDITTRVMADEARHVAFGVLSLEGLYTREMSAGELREREEFVMEASYLMRERLLMEQVFERMGLDTDRWLRWSLETPFMQGFRQMLFSKIVPNLKRLGLLTPRVRSAYEKLDLLRYEDGKDSTQDAEIAPPAELVKLLLEMRQGNPAAA
jgi:hypothetical protein